MVEPWTVLGSYAFMIFKVPENQARGAPYRWVVWSLKPKQSKLESSRRGCETQQQARQQVQETIARHRGR